MPSSCRLYRPRRRLSSTCVAPLLIASPGITPVYSRVPNSDDRADSRPDRTSCEASPVPRNRPSPANSPLSRRNGGGVREGAFSGSLDSSGFTGGEGASLEAARLLLAVPRLCMRRTARWRKFPACYALGAWGLPSGALGPPVGIDPTSRGLDALGCASCTCSTNSLVSSRRRASNVT